MVVAGNDITVNLHVTTVYNSFFTFHKVDLNFHHILTASKATDPVLNASEHVKVPARIFTTDCLHHTVQLDAGVEMTRHKITCHQINFPRDQDYGGP